MIEIALQLYTVRSHTARNMLPTLRTLATMGYRSFEFSGYGNATPRDIRAVLDELELRALGAHIDYEQLATHPQQLLREMHSLGCQYVVLAWLPQERRSTLNSARHLAEEFNRYGALFARENLTFVYHNYVTDFMPLHGSSVLHELITHTDPALVHFELDTYWAKYAGLEPVEFIEHYGERIPLLHCKDIAADHIRADVPVGTGIMPWRQLFAACDPALQRWAVVEQDHPRNALESVQISLRNLQDLLK
jgi:sugar phosphate isomerase/epimerase